MSSKPAPETSFTDPSLPSVPSVEEARLQRPAPAYLGHSAASRRVQAQIHRVIHGNSPVLLIGAKGTGKRTVAKLLHHFGGGEIPTLQIVDLERALLGPLEPIGDYAYVAPVEALSLTAQAKLIDQVGLARMILGTRLAPDSPEGHRRLSRQLLRWCPVRVPLPSLAERIEDLEVLALKIISETPARRPLGGISDSALECLRSHHWPGNVSELRAVLTRAIAAGTTEQIELHDLPPQLRLRDLGIGGIAAPEAPDHQFSLTYAERSAIERAMRHARGNKRKAARLLQVGKTTLYRKLREYELDQIDPDAADPRA